MQINRGVNMELKNKRLISFVIMLYGLSFLLMGMSLQLCMPLKSNLVDSQILNYYSNNTEDFIYLSDIDYIANQSYTRYDKIRYDEVSGGGKITVKIENSAFTFKKGIWAHANSQITYDISKYDYKYFTAFVGLNTTSTRGDGVRFYIYTSVDGQNWGDAKYDEVKLPGEVATYVKVELGEANYIRLIANQIASNGNDHSVYADAKLTNDDTQNSSFKSVDEYNEILKSQYSGQTAITGEYEFTLLKKEFIKNVGEYTLNSFYNESDDNKAVIDFLMSNPNALRYYILGGKPAGTYYNSLSEYSRLYRNYKEDFNN